MSDAEIEDLKGLMTKARKRPVNFAICMGKAPDGTVVLGHLRKDPEVLARQAKKAGETPKVAFGAMEVSGKKLLLTCPEAPPGGIAKRTKAFLMLIKMPMKVIFLDANGAVIQDDGEDETSDDAEGATQAPLAEDTPGHKAAPDQAAAWARVESMTTAMVQKMADQGAAKAGQVQAAWKAAQAAAAAGDFATATAVVAKLKPILTAFSGQASDAAQAPDALAAQWAKAQAAIGPRYEMAMALQPENAGKLRAAWAMAVQKADGADFQAALTIIARLEPAVEAVIAAGPAQSVVAAGTVAFQKSRVLWVTARSKMMAEVHKLAEAINAAAEGDELADEIRAAAADIVAEVEQIDTRLQEALDSLTNAEGASRDAMKRQAAGILAEYQALLAKGIFTRIDDNPFAPVSVATTARNALNVISRTLAA
ncbi:hypothetical protein [Pseudophaeobacter leonis]|uniref:hypothetical protein n=1 Tax=Pseudophaeobacter leonis TaxID=1144477 RepID=UPI00111C0ACA|nr:hypothetical protein [Pseudophaeobacter leonis]